MSRRKQANPRPLITVVGDQGQEEEREPSLSPSPSITVSENEQDSSICDPDLVSDTPIPVFPTNCLPQSVTPGIMLPGYQDKSVSISRTRSLSATPSDTSLSSSPPNPSSLSNSYTFQSDLSKKSNQKILPVSSEDGKSCFICPVCQKELTTSHDLTIHIRSHNISSSTSQANTCTICGKILSSQSSLDRHMLVHSGERPFKCKICKMSFTTNGNMHRHSRIHKKDDLSLQGVKGGGTRKAKTKLFSKPEIHPALLPPPSLLQGAALDQFGLSVMKPNNVIRNFKNFTPESFTSVAAPMVSSLYKGDNSQVFMKQEQDVPVSQAPSVSMECGEGELHCPVCNKSFLCQSGLDSHLDTHADSPISCSACSVVLPNPRSLAEHKAKEHSSTSGAAQQSPAKPDPENDSKVSSGFFDLNFVNFSVSKFPLIAKSWCERNSRQANSVYHHFVCRFCSKAFPCKSALFLHMFIHNRQQLSTCPFCDCDFIGGAILHTHMLKHMSDTAISEAAPTMPHDIGKDHFLASLGIAAKSNLEAVSQVDDALSENSCWLSNLEKRDNVEYFGKLGQCYIPGGQIDVQQGSPALLGAETTPLNVVSAASAAAAEGGGKELFLKDFSDFRNMVYLQAVADGLPKEGIVPVWTPPALYPSFAACLSVPQFPTSLLPSSLNPAKDSLTMAVPSGIHGDSPMLTSDEGQNVGREAVMDGSLVKKEGTEISSKDVFPCKFCDMVFSNYRALKGHTRTHLGLSPYKCNLCNYSSADKSTLIRHLRTHNGERPFQCLICEFAFTTKANCERHVRKKHCKVMKKDIEDCIGYNKYVLESPSMVDSFHSPDTVCKYCGIDFKFFRALKHHLRSHSSCRQKPFLCQKCEVGFSTKANCVRHLQKQHPEISQLQIENWIHVNEPSLLDDADTCYSDSRDSPSPTGSSDNAGFLSPSPSPPVAHHGRLFLKQENPVDGGQPLDFSVKPYSQVSAASAGQPVSSDQPIDLSVKKPQSDSSSPENSVKPKSELSSLLVSTKDFDKKTPEKTYNNRQKLTDLLTSRDNNNNNNNSHKLWGMTTVLSTATPIIEYPPMNPSLLSQSLPARIVPETKIHSAFFRNYNPVDGTDLASVSNIINNTSEVKRFQSFFQPTCSPENDADNDDVVSCSSSIDIHFDSRSVTPTSPAMNQMEASSGDNSQEKLEVIIKGETNPNGSLSPYGKQAAREEKRSDNTHDQSSPEGGSPGTTQDLTTPVKKKRNSYADSPHKLNCPCCPRSFPWISSLNRHLLTHTGQKPFKCPRCPVTFSTKSNRERHLIRKHGVNMLDPASRQTMDRPYKCHLCVFSSFATESNLLKHYQERHKGEKPSAESYLNLESSPSCTLSDNEGGDDYDISQTPGGSTGTNCSDDEDNKSLSNIRETVKDDYTNDITVTMETDQNGSSCGNADVDAKACNASPPVMDEEDDSVDLSGFPSSEWKKMQINPERDNYNVDKITQCWKCGQDFPLRKLLVRHLKDHNIDLPFKCYLCDASFEKRQDCLQHQEKSHPQDWVVLKDKNGVDNVERFSTRVDRLVEKHCQGMSLQGPERNGQGLGGAVVDDDRDDLAGLDDGLTDTMTSDYQQRKVYCSLCPKRFWSLQDLRRHMRSHTGERPFECDVCFKRFTLKHSMMRHRKKHLGSTTPPLSDDDDNAVNSDDNITSMLGKNALRFHLASQKNMTDNQIHSNSVAMVQSSQASLQGDGDLLHNLLGVEVGAIDKMLNSADSADSAAQLLGVK